MKRLVWVLAALAKSQDYNLITTQCDGEDATLILEYVGNSQPDWNAFETGRTGSCEEGINDSFNRAYSDDNNQMMVTFDPYACSDTSPNPADVTSYDVDMQVTFGEASDAIYTVDGKRIGLGRTGGFYWIMQAKCRFASSYTTSALFKVSQNTATTATYNLGDGEQLLEFEVHATNELFRESRGSDEYTTDNMVHHIVGLRGDLDTRGDSNGWAFPKQDIWTNFHVAPTLIRVKDAHNNHNGWFLDLLTEDLETCGYTLINFRAVGFHDDPAGTNPMGTFAWGISYRGFTANDADGSDLTLEVTLALCHKDDPNSACVAALAKCTEREINPDAVPAVNPLDTRTDEDISNNACYANTGTFSNLVHEDQIYVNAFITDFNCNVDYGNCDEDNLVYSRTSGEIGTKKVTLGSLYPASYDDNMFCRWKFKVPFGKQINFHVREFDVENNSECLADYVTFSIQTDPAGTRQCLRHTEDSQTPNDGYLDVCNFWGPTNSPLNGTPDNYECVLCRYCSEQDSLLSDSSFGMLPAIVEVQNTAPYSSYPDLEYEVSVVFVSDYSATDLGFLFDWEIVDHVDPNA